MTHLYTTYNEIATTTTTIRQMHDVGKLENVISKISYLRGICGHQCGDAAPVNGRFRGRFMQPGEKGGRQAL